MSHEAGTSHASLCVAARVENLDAIRRLVEETAAACGVDPTEIARIILAVDEAATNIIVHGYRDRPKEIDIQVQCSEKVVEILLRDSAPLFDPTSVPAPDLTVPLEQRPTGGVGVHLIRQIMDQVTHRVTSQGGNELLLVKWRMK